MTPGNTPAPKAMKPPYRHITLIYTIDIRGIQFDPSDDLVYHAQFEYLVNVYDAADGKLVNSSAMATKPNLPAAVYKSMLASGAQTAAGHRCPPPRAITSFASASTTSATTDTSVQSKSPHPPSLLDLHSSAAITSQLPPLRVPHVRRSHFAKVSHLCLQPTKQCLRSQAERRCQTPKESRLKARHIYTSTAPTPSRRCISGLR